MCKVLVRMTLTEILKDHNLVGVTTEAKTQRKLVVVGSASVTLSAGGSRAVKISLSGTGRRLLATRHKLKVRLRVTQTFASAPGAAPTGPRTVSAEILTFKVRHKRQ
jgi:hypothetical protein